MPAHPLLWIAPHVRACRSGEQVILLDLQHNRYLGVGGAAATALEGAVSGWPHAGTGPADPSSRQGPSALSALVAPLVARGLLVQSPVEPPRLDPLMPPTASWPEEERTGSGAVDMPGLCRLLCHATAAALALRRQSFANIAARLTASRARHPQPSSPHRPDTWRGTVDTYVRLRPLVLSARERCLHDSLTLARLLATEDALARWVIGVRASPFAAHAWVQRGAVVLGDDPDRVRRFVPILVA